MCHKLDLSVPVSDPHTMKVAVKRSGCNSEMMAEDMQ